MRTMLFDFYGELLTVKQREYFDLHYNDDLSLSEIAEQTGTSRQAVWDIIKRADAILRQTEEKTGLVRRFTQRREAVRAIETELSALLDRPEEPVRSAAAAALEKLRELKD